MVAAFIKLFALLYIHLIYNYQFRERKKNN